MARDQGGEAFALCTPSAPARFPPSWELAPQNALNGTGEAGLRGMRDVGGAGTRASELDSLGFAAGVRVAPLEPALSTPDSSQQ